VLHRLPEPRPSNDTVSTDDATMFVDHNASKEPSWSFDFARVNRGFDGVQPGRMCDAAVALANRVHLFKNSAQRMVIVLPV
jgi:hypothetical protein